MSSSCQSSQIAPSAVLCGIALGAFLASLTVALPSAAQRMGGTGGSGTGGSGTGGSGTGGSSMTGAGGSLDDPGAVCTFAEYAECPERCPMYATCFVSGTGGQESRVYYRVQEQRFECAGLDCDSSAVKQLGDYCCERGEFAPSKGDGGGCLLPGGVAAGASSSEGWAPWLGVSLGLCASALGLRRRARGQ
jgi:hypothetical protein